MSRFIAQLEDGVIVRGQGKVLNKHLAGRHSQQSHAGGRGGSKFTTFSEAYKGVKVTEDERDVLAYYTQTDYKGINLSLRSGRKVDSAGKPTTNDALWDYSISQLDSAIAKGPEVEREKPIWRVMSPKSVIGLQQGQTYSDKGFVSTTFLDLSNPRNEEMKNNFMLTGGVGNVLTKILPNGNYKGLSLNRVLSADYGDRSEKEFLLPRNSQFTFLGFETLASKETIAVMERAN